MHEQRRVAAHTVHQLRLVDDDDHPIAGGRPNLFAPQRAAEALDQIERAARDLIGAVDCNIDAAMLGEARERRVHLSSGGCRLV